MTDKEALRMALEALEHIDYEDNDRDFLFPYQCTMLDKAITAINQALAAPVQEPVKFMRQPTALPDVPEGWNLEIVETEFGDVRLTSPDGVAWRFRDTDGSDHFVWKFLTAILTTPPAAPVQDTEAHYKGVVEGVQKLFDDKRAQPAPVQEPVNLLEARKIAAEYGTPDSQVDNGNLYFALSKCLEHIDAQPAPVQEPVAKYIGECSDGSLVQLYEDVKKGTDFYTTPPAAKRQWVGLTDEEIQVVLDNPQKYYDTMNNFARAIEAKLKEKNT